MKVYTSKSTTCGGRRRESLLMISSLQKVVLAIAVALFLTALMGCAQRSLVGTWEAPNLPNLEFTADNKARATITVAGMTIEFAGDFAVVDGTTLQLSNFTLSQGGQPVQGMIGQMAAGMVDQQQSYTLDWTSNDQITLNGPGMLSGTWTRRVQ